MTREIAKCTFVLWRFVRRNVRKEKIVRKTTTNRENVMYVIQNTIVKLVYECSCRPLILCSYPDL